MAKKPFVSISFTPEKIQVLEMNSQKTRIKKFSSIDLPVGLINKYKVTDSDSLAKIIKGIWSKLGFKEKTVGLIVPEFSTYTKLLDIENLKLSDLDEAVRWQILDFLPGNQESMVLDWKIVSKGENKLTVLVVAIEKNILEGYVNSVEKAGVYPLAVETPSITISRLVKEDGENLIFYKISNGEAILVLADGEKILGSSVVSMDDTDEVVNSAKRIVSHYPDSKLEKILVGGSNISQQLLESLEKEFGKKAQALTFNIDGIKDDSIQDYLIPLSLQIEELSEPSDMYSINLLPLALVNKYESARSKNKVWSTTLTITLFTWTTFLLALGVYLLLSQQTTDAMNQSTKRDSLQQQKQQAINDINSINSISDKVLSIKNVTYYPHVLLKEINNALLPGITLSGYKFDLDKGNVKLTGISVDRPTLIKFKQNLESNSDIGSISIPISNLATETNLDFEVDYQYLPISSSSAIKIPSQ